MLLAIILKVLADDKIDFQSSGGISYLLAALRGICGVFDVELGNAEVAKCDGVTGI